jgi:2-keto-4-pentenoate hydratase/2-oxohepta-3-ene-1,7-dioic acid hydratase in catechol pathway
MPGDLIWTGTPPGVILGHENPVWLKDGDVVEVSIEGIGTCINKVEFSTKEDKSFKAKF